MNYDRALLGRIIQISEPTRQGNETISYKYDSLGALKSVFTSAQHCTRCHAGFE